MEIRLGRTLGDDAVSIELSSTATVLLVGDTDRGKTTLARYLARWWIAAAPRHLHLIADSPDEWADMPTHPPLSTAPSHDEEPCGAGLCMLVVDDADRIPATVLDELNLEDLTAIITTSSAPGLPRHLGEGALAMGLLRGPLLEPTDLGVFHGDARLDWPSDTVVIIPDQRGPHDFPCHRWQVPPELQGSKR